MRVSARSLLLIVLLLLVAGGAGQARAKPGAASRAVLGTFSFVGGGDIALTGGPDARVFAGLSRFLRDRDLVIGNLEGTLATTALGIANGADIVRVHDVADSMDRLRAAGVAFAFPEVYDTGVCHMAFFSDPDGNALMLHHR